MTPSTSVSDARPAIKVGQCYHCRASIFKADMYIAVKGPNRPATLVCAGCNARILARIDAERAKRQVVRHG